MQINGKEVPPEEAEEWLFKYAERLTEPVDKTLDRYERAIFKGLADYLVPVEPGSLPSTAAYSVQHNGENHVYTLAEGAPDSAELRIDALSSIRVARDHASHDGDPGWLLRCGIEIGSFVTRIRDLPAIKSAVESRSRAARGGAATRRTTPEQDETIRSVFVDFESAGVSMTEQARRAAAKLKKDHNIEVSSDTVLRRMRAKAVQR